MNNITCTRRTECVEVCGMTFDWLLDTSNSLSETSNGHESDLLVFLDGMYPLFPDETGFESENVKARAVSHVVLYLDGLKLEKLKKWERYVNQLCPNKEHQSNLVSLASFLHGLIFATENGGNHDNRV